MDVLLLSPNQDQCISPYKHIRNRGRIINNNNYHGIGIVSSRNENFSGFHQNIINGGERRGGVLILPPPPPSQSSFTSSSSRRRHPPLLPLPTSKPYSSLNNLYGGNNKGVGGRGRALSTSPPSNENNLIPKKPKSSISPNKQESTTKSSKSKTADRLGPEPGNLPKQVSKVMRSTLEENEGSGVLEEICGSSIFLLAPPPSSLPLPKFSLKPKMMISCNVEAAATTTTEIDAGATDDLRRLLRL